MTLVELIEQVAIETGLSKDAASRAIKSAIKITYSTAIGGEDVSLVGFGKFRRKIFQPKMAFGKLTSKKVGIKFTPFDSTFRRDNGEESRST